MTFRFPLLLLVPSVLAACGGDEPGALDPAGDPTAVVAPSITAPPCDPCLVGPVVLERGRGAPETRAFTFTAAPASRAVLHLDDGGSRGANAIVTLNGATLPWPAAMDGRREPRAALDVTLLAANTLTIRLTGKPGSTLRVALAGEAAPRLVTLTIQPRRSTMVTSGAVLGPASGIVTAPGIACALVDSVASGDCTEAYPAGTTVTLQATAGARSRFVEYAWALGGSMSPTRDVTLTTDSTIAAFFAPLPSRLEVTIVGPGADGRVNGNEISCYMRDGVQEGMCAQDYLGGQLDFILRAFGYGDGDPFTGWEGACTGTVPECRITSQPGDTVRVTARFGG